MSFSTGKGKPRRETNALSESSDSDCVYSSFGIWEEEKHPYVANMSIKDKVEMSARRFQKPRYPVETDSMSDLTDGEETDPEAGEEEPLMTNQGVDVMTPVRGKKKDKPLWDSMEAGDGENATLLDDWGYTPSPDDTPVRPGKQTSSYQGRQSDEHLPNLVAIEGIDVQPLSSIRGSNSQLQTGISKVDPNSSAEPDPVQQGARSEAREDVKHQHRSTAAELLSSKECASEEEMHEGQWAADTSEGIWYRPVQMTAESTIQPSCIPKQDKLATQNTTIDDLLAHKEIELDISCSELSQDTERKSDLVGPYNQQPYGMDEHDDRIGVNQSRKSHTSHKFSIEMPHAKTLHTENEATEPQNVQESVGAVKEMRDAAGKSLPAAHDTFTTAIPAFEASQEVLQSSEKVQVAAEDIFPYDKHADQASEGFPRHAQKNDAAADEPVPSEVMDEDVAADEPVPSELVEEDVAADEPVPSEVVEEDVAADEPVPSEVVEEDVAAEVAAEEVVEEHAATDELTPSEAVSVAAPEEEAAEEAVEQHAAADKPVPSEAVSVAAPAEVSAEEAVEQHAATDEAVFSEVLDVTVPAEEAVAEHAAADEPLPSEVPDGEAIDEVAADGLELGDAGAPQLASRVETGGVPGESFVLLEANVSGNQETDLSRNTEPHSIEGEVTFERPDIDEFPTHNPDVEKKSSSAKDAMHVTASTAESISVQEAEPRRKPRKQISGRIAQAIASLGAEPAKGLELSIEGKQDQFDTASIRVNDSKVGQTKLRNFTACDISTESKSGSSKREGSGRMAKEKENHRETSPRAKNVSPKMVDGIARWQSCLNAHSSQDQPFSVEKNIRALSPTTSSVNRNVNQQTTQLSPTCQKDHHKGKPVKSPSKENVQPASLEKHRFKEARIELDPIPYEKLKKMKAGSGIDTTKKELYLSDDDFYKVFQCSRTAFSAMKSWRQAAEKKKVGLF